MSRRVRVCLLAGCAVIALLEARRAGDTLSAGLSGPYAAERSTGDLRAELPASAAHPTSAPVLLWQPAEAPIADWFGRGGR